MKAVGRWHVTMVNAMARQDMVLHVLTQNGGFTGIIESAMGNMEIAGAVEGDRLAWVMDVRKPVPIKVTCDVGINGDALNGTAKLGFLGKAAMTGTRAAGQAPPAVTPNQGSVPPQVTGDSVDPLFSEAVIDLDEWRESPVPHRYIHGRFLGTDARFSFYFPPKEKYQGRFFQNTYPMATSSDIGPFPIQFEVATGDLGFTFDSGAYYVQTNLGGADRMPPADPAIAAYRVNAAAAKYSRKVAAELYGPHRPYGYLFGGSGGSYQTIGGAENTRGVWDGFVPFVMATPNAIPSMFTVRMHAMRVLRQRNSFSAIIDAINPGGGGDPYATLNDEERAALREATQLGFPPRGWWSHETMTSGYFYNVAPLMPMLDPTYVDDFWNEPGYLGSDPEDPIHTERFSFDTTIAAVNAAFPVTLELSEIPDRDIADAHLILLTGSSAGKSIPIASAHDRTLGFAFAADQAALGGIQPGDGVRIDNSWPLALQTYQRHQVPTADMHGWNQYRDATGNPAYPQRDVLIGPIAAAGTAGSVPNGSISGKMLLLECLMDIDALPWQADWYRSQVAAALGPGFEDNFAIWFIDHAQHDNPPTPKAHAHTVSYAGALQQALRDVSAWVEQGVRPSSTRYSVTADNQVQVPDQARDRGGIQPVVMLKANGRIRAEVTVGQTVTFAAEIEAPPGAGKVVGAEWDFLGAGDYAECAIDRPETCVRLTAAHAFAHPGTYFPVLRATSQRDGNAQTPYGRVQNIGRVRVVVR